MAECEKGNKIFLHDDSHPQSKLQVMKMGEKLQGLQQEKHQLFLQLKKVLHEEEKRRRKEQRYTGWFCFRSPAMTEYWLTYSVAFMCFLSSLVISQHWLQPATNPASPCTQGSTSSVFKVSPLLPDPHLGYLENCHSPLISIDEPVLLLASLRQPSQPQSTRCAARRA